MAEGRGEDISDGGRGKGKTGVPMGGEREGIWS